MIPDVQDADFDTVVERSEVPVLVEFWQPGCGHCQALLAQLEKVRVVLQDRIYIVRMNVQENSQIPADLEIQSLPTLALYHRGEFVKFIGGIGKSPYLIARLEEYLLTID